jgi:hypothetical protein
MAPEEKAKKNWKKKFVEEFIEYWINVAYMAIFFGIFITYKRLVLAEYNIVYTDFGFGLINALILGKVVSIGGMMRLGRLKENRPLILSTLSKTVIFTVWLAVFNAIELTIKGVFKTYTFQGSLDSLSHIGTYDYFGGLLVVFVSFIPFFAFKDLSTAMGSRLIINLFMKGTSAASVNSPLNT